MNDVLTPIARSDSPIVIHSRKPNIGTSRVHPITLRHLIPLATVLICSIVGPVIDRSDCPASTDGPQFRCWLERDQRQNPTIGP